MGMGGGRGAGISLRSIRNLRTFSSFKNPVYRLYYAGMLGQMVSMNMQMIARSLLIYRLTNSSAILGAMSLFNALPMLFLSLFGGVIADRVHKKYVLLLGQAGSALVSLGVALSLSLGYLSAERAGSWWILGVSSAFQGVIMGLMMPSRQAILPEIVDEEQLMNAISLNNMGMNVLRLLGPAISGFLIDVIGFAAVYYVTTGSYIMSVIFISFLPLTGTITIKGQGALTEIKEGLRYIRRERTIFIVLMITLFSTILAMPVTQLMPVFSETVLNVGASGLGMLMSVSGAGAIAGSLVLASLPNRKRGIMMLSLGIILSIALTAFAFSKSWPLSLCVIAFFGLGQTGQMALSNTLLQYYVDNDYRGRVMSILMMQFGLTSFATFMAGVTMEIIGPQWSIGGFAVILFIISVGALVLLPRIRNLD
jgi:MFS family permease